MCVGEFRVRVGGGGQRPQLDWCTTIVHGGRDLKFRSH